MPELPEVETLTKQLRQVVVGKTIAKVKIAREKSFQGDPQSLLFQTITAVKRQAKVIIIRFQKPHLTLLVHLKMTGQLIYIDKKNRIVGGHPTPDWVNELPGKHTRVILIMSDDSRVFFNDMRVFGWLKAVTTQAEFNQEMRSFTGIEPNSKDFNGKTLRLLLGKTKRPVKIALMDQSKVAGVGNIYANDALWKAGIRPDRLASELNGQEWEKLATAVNEVIAEGIRHKGASESTYKHLDGMGGTYQDHFLVYKRTDQPCRTCATKIQKQTIGGRGSFWCPRCQK